jgi:medium-chain acyl-[acyl-carrier-protein] hydrolase
MDSSVKLDQHCMSRRWLPYYRAQAESKLRLLCFAHAGGSAVQFRRWERGLPNTVEICAVQLPGRETRVREPFITRIPPLIDELVDVLWPVMDRPVAVLGHSLGARIGFEFVRRICARSDTGRIAHLFVSGSPAPHVPRTQPPSFNLPEREFIQVLKDYGGTPPEVFADPELLQFLLPRLRADLELYDTYVFTSGQPLDVPITAFAGELDPRTTPETVKAWSEHTRSKFRFRVFPGSHFFLYANLAQVLPFIIRDLDHLL